MTHNRMHIIKIISRYCTGFCLEELKKIIKYLRTVAALTEIQTQYLLNTSQKPSEPSSCLQSLPGNGKKISKHFAATCCLNLQDYLLTFTLYPHFCSNIS
jgi:hypothetical protein